MKNTFTPKIGIIIIVLFLIVSAIVMVSNREKNTNMTSSASDSPKNDNSNLAAKIEKSGNVGEYYDGTKSATATTSASAIPSPTNMSQFIFPAAKTKSSTAKKLELESTESAEEVTEWYKNKIRDLNFNAKSFSQTTTNGEILNKLSAARPGEKIDVTIKNDQTTSKVLITVDRS